MNPEQEIRLEKIFRDNQNKGIAIAITGCWGVGKTFAWNKFRNQYLLTKKYVYVSLFGLEYLGDLKTHIYSHIENNNSPIEIPRWLRGLPSILKETKISQFGISTSANIIDSLMFNQVKDAVICFDDFERMSKKLDIKDVMGLANQLKLERNCQVILILDESKTDEENKKKYAEYKEKLIDETIKITSVESLLRNKAKEAEIDDSLVDLMVKFADALGIHNFRFFQKVIKLYKQFRDQLPIEVADSTKEVILVRILQGYLIEDFSSKYEFNWSDITFVGFENDQGKWTETKKQTFKIFDEHMPFYFLNLDNWVLEFSAVFKQERDFDFQLINELIDENLTNENYESAKENINKLILQYKNYNLPSNFAKNLAYEIKKTIKFDALKNIKFYCSLLSEFDEQEEINQIDQLVKEHLKSEFHINRDRMLKRYYWHEDKEQKYRKFIKDLLDDPNSFQQQEFLKILKLYIQEGKTAYGSKQILSQMTKEHLEKFIRDEYPYTFKALSLKTICEKIIELYEYQQSQMVQQVKIWLKEIIEDIGKSKGYPQHYISYFTENL